MEVKTSSPFSPRGSGSRVWGSTISARKLLDLLAHGGRPGLGPEDPDPQGQLADVDFQLRRALGDRQGVRGGAEERRGPEIFQQGDLPFGQPRARGHDHAAQAREPLVKPEASGEEPVAVGVLGDVVRPDACRPEVAGHALGPLIQVLGRVRAGDRLAGRTGRGVHPHHLRKRHGAQAEGVVVPQVVFDRKRQFGDILEGFDILGRYTGFVQLPAVKGDARISPLDGLLQLAQLELLKLGDRHGFEFFIPIFLAGTFHFARFARHKSILPLDSDPSPKAGHGATVAFTFQRANRRQAF